MHANSGVCTLILHELLIAPCSVNPWQLLTTQLFVQIEQHKKIVGLVFVFVVLETGSYVAQYSLEINQYVTQVAPKFVSVVLWHKC